jgi:hypothetical protein
MSVSEDSRDTRRLIPLFAAIVLVEVVVMIALYWFGRHFGSL